MACDATIPSFWGDPDGLTWGKDPAIMDLKTIA
jgi:hypothetical protein